jgi:diguanylate cyclase (GGDEF)-like protein
MEIARAKRNHSSLAYAMIDIDHFKRVNDTYGHPTGDGVLKSLARLLQQRLRKTDVIGRYGGEEFAVILPEAEPLQAKQCLDEIRTRFSQIRQQSGNEEFAVTFSAGIAAYPTCGEARGLNDSADRALYLAKQNGRNRIVIT